MPKVVTVKKCCENADFIETQNSYLLDLQVLTKIDLFGNHEKVYKSLQILQTFSEPWRGMESNLAFYSVEALRRQD